MRPHAHLCQALGPTLDARYSCKFTPASEGSMQALLLEPIAHCDQRLCMDRMRGDPATLTPSMMALTLARIRPAAAAMATLAVTSGRPCRHWPAASTTLAGTSTPCSAPFLPLTRVGASWGEEGRVSWLMRMRAGSPGAWASCRPVVLGDLNLPVPLQPPCRPAVTPAPS